MNFQFQSLWKRITSNCKHSWSASQVSAFFSIALANSDARKYWSNNTKMACQAKSESLLDECLEKLKDSFVLTSMPGLRARLVCTAGLPDPPNPPALDAPQVVIICDRHSIWVPSWWVLNERYPSWWHAGELRARPGGGEGRASLPDPPTRTSPSCFPGGNHMCKWACRGASGSLFNERSKQDSLRDGQCAAPSKIVPGSCTLQWFIYQQRCCNSNWLSFWFEIQTSKGVQELLLMQMHYAWQDQLVVIVFRWGDTWQKQRCWFLIFVETATNLLVWDSNLQ